MQIAGRYKAVLWLLGGVVAFLIGREFSSTGNDFIVYHAAARSLIAGRTDLYASDFALTPPMMYVYPPLFLLLVFPIGWLDFPNMFGLCFALMALAVAAIVRKMAREWRPRNRWLYGASIVLIAGPYATLCFRSGNAHLFVVMLVVFALLAWSRGSLWWASLAVALGGAIKIFPLFLIPVFAARRNWALVTRSVALTLVIWALPALYFGPRHTAELYRSWYASIGGDMEDYKRQRAVDLSMPGVVGRWLAPVDYSRHVDPGYPQVNFASMAPGTVRSIVLVVQCLLAVLTLWMCASLPRSGNPRDIAATGALAITATLLLGPYTPIQHLSALLVAAMTLPVAFGDVPAARALVGIGAVNALLFAIPGSANQRAFQASGMFTLVGLAVWGASMLAARRLIR
jgi:hypothetical protein